MGCPEKALLGRIMEVTRKSGGGVSWIEEVVLLMVVLLFLSCSGKPPNTLATTNT
jgi:hypothetical protein